jgi:DNA-binding MarR family transcriptional regulator
MYPDKYHRLVGTQAKRRVSPASEAWGLMFRLLQQSKRRFGAIASEFELSPPQVHALRLLDPDEPKPMSELAERLHCDNSNVTGIVDRLEDRGLVERRPAEHDRRVKMLAITPAGADIRARLAERLEVPPEPLARLSADDQRALRDIMRRAFASD